MSHEPIDPASPDAVDRLLAATDHDEPDTNGEQPPADGSDERVVYSPADPLPNARAFLNSVYTDTDGCRLLVAPNGEMYRWDGRCWPPVDEAALRADLYRWFDVAVYWQSTGDNAKLTPFQPNKAKVANLLDALRAEVHRGGLTAPCWIGDDGPVPADELVVVDNGLLHVPSRTLYPHTPALFTHHAVPFAYDPDAPEPAAWLDFLHQLWPHDAECIDALQEWFGYLLSGRTDLQKMLLLVGPRRSGKGTIGRVLKALLGGHNVAGPTLSSLTGTFGLQQLLGKPLALVSDARLSGRTGQDTLVERLLSISGEDLLTVERKHRTAVDTQLPTRFVMLTNELPRLTDSSGALASRFVVLTLIRSWYGHEDPALTARLLPELPGILRWALDGLDRVAARGRFTEPESSRQTVRELEDLGSPVGAFVRDRCHVAADAAAPVADLWTAWKRWCEDHGRDHVGTRHTFGRDLGAAVPGLKVTQPRDANDRRYRAYQGIRLLTPSEEPDSSDRNGEARVPPRASDPEAGLARAGTRTTALQFDEQEPLEEPGDGKEVPL